MNESTYQELLEASWQRKLTSEEDARLQVYLADHPLVQSRWAEEAALNECLQHLSPAPVPSNFTARVLQAIDTEELHRERTATASPGLHAWLNRFLPRLASLGVVLVLSIAGFHQYRSFHRGQVAQNAAMISDLAAIPGPEILKDFEAIHQMRQVTSFSDDDLVTALQ